MKTLFDTHSEECFAFAEGVEREWRKLPDMTPSQIMSELESNLNHIKTCIELGFVDGLFVEYVNKQGGLLVKQLQNMEMV